MFMSLTFVCTSHAPNTSVVDGVNKLFAIKFALRICSRSPSLSDDSESEELSDDFSDFLKILVNYLPVYSDCLLFMR